MKHTKETKAKMRKAWKTRRLTFVPPMKGKKMSTESRRKMSESAKGHPSNRLGKPHSKETRAKISKIVRERTPRGAQHYAYKDGKKQRNIIERKSLEYQDWRKAVFERDSYTCQHCGDDRGGNLHAHHINSWSSFPDQRYEVSNGLTLCVDCHERVHLKPMPQYKVRRKKHPAPVGL